MWFSPSCRGPVRQVFAAWDHLEAPSTLAGLDHSGNRGNRVPFQPVVYENERPAFRSSRFALGNQRPASRPRLRVFFLDAVIRLKCLYRLLLFAPSLEQEPGGDEVRVRPAPRQRLCI